VGELDRIFNGLDNISLINNFLDYFIDNYLIECSQNDILSTPPFENIDIIKDQSSDIDDSVFEFFEDFIKKMKEDRLENFEQEANEIFKEILDKFK
jgi:hypothetical protein